MPGRTSSSYTWTQRSFPIVGEIECPRRSPASDHLSVEGFYPSDDNGQMNAGHRMDTYDDLLLPGVHPSGELKAISRPVGHSSP